MIQSRQASAAAGYKTTPLVAEVISGYLPESERGSRAAFLPGRGERSPRVAVPTREIVCYECGKRSRIPVAALSAHCVHCCAHLNTADVTLKAGSRRLTVRTLGDVILPAEASLSHLSIVCRNLTIAGKAEGNIRCNGVLTLRGEARINGQARAEKLLVESGARAECSPGISVQCAEVDGYMEGRVHAQDYVHISKNGALAGDCRGARLMVDPGGVHRGVWVREAL